MVLPHDKLLVHRLHLALQTIFCGLLPPRRESKTEQSLYFNVLPASSSMANAVSLLHNLLSIITEIIGNNMRCSTCRKRKYGPLRLYWHEMWSSSHWSSRPLYWDNINSLYSPTHTRVMATYQYTHPKASIHHH